MYAGRPNPLPHILRLKDTDKTVASTKPTKMLLRIAFTTFSAFILKTGHLVRSAEWIYAAANVILQTGLGFASLFVGMALARLA